MPAYPVRFNNSACSASGSFWSRPVPLSNAKNGLGAEAARRRAGNSIGADASSHALLPTG
jgi:hypothetical protein